VAVSFATMPTAVPLIRGDKIRPIAVTTTHRAAGLPNVPTMQEAGIRDYDIVLYNGMLAPAGLPADITARLRTEIHKAMQAPEVQKFYATVSADAVTSTPEELSAHMTAEIKKLAQAVQASGARAD
jgi:tripartite-type tricarboxylate transporter receptor subunit TctC